MVIAHHSSTIRSPDQILVVEDSSIVERGTREELLAAAARCEDLHPTELTVQEKGAVEEDALAGG